MCAECVFKLYELRFSLGNYSNIICPVCNQCHQLTNSEFQMLTRNELNAYLPSSYLMQSLIDIYEERSKSEKIMSTEFQSEMKNVEYRRKSETGLCQKCKKFPLNQQVEMSSHRPNAEEMPDAKRNRYIVLCFISLYLLLVYKLMFFIFQIVYYVLIMLFTVYMYIFKFVFYLFVIYLYFIVGTYIFLQTDGWNCASQERLGHIFKFK